MGLILPAASPEMRPEHKALLRQARFFVQKKESSNLPTYNHLRSHTVSSDVPKVVSKVKARGMSFWLTLRMEPRPQSLYQATKQVSRLGGRQ